MLLWAVYSTEAAISRRLKRQIPEYLVFLETPAKVDGPEHVEWTPVIRGLKRSGDSSSWWAADNYCFTI